MHKSVNLRSHSCDFWGKGYVILEWNILHRIDSIINPKNSKQILGKQIKRSTGLLYKLLPTNLRVYKPTFYNFYTSHLRWNITIYHTDLRQNAVFHNFSRRIALSKYSGRSIVGFKRNRSKSFQNHPYGQPVLISIVWAVSVVESLNEL